MLQEKIDEQKEPPGKMPHLQGAYNVNTSLPIIQIIPPTLENKHIYENGVSHLLHRLTVKVHSDWETCHALWDSFSPKRTVFHSWEYRCNWGKEYQLVPYFYTIYDGRKAIAVAPLSFCPGDQTFHWFGSEYWMEDNQFFVKDPLFVNLLLKILPRPLSLNAIEDIPFSKLYDNIFQEDDEKFVKDIHTFRSKDDYVNSLEKKPRYNLRKDIEFIEQYEPRVEIITQPTENDLQTLVQMSIDRFTAKDEPSNFRELDRVQAFRNTLFLDRDYGVRFIKVSIQNRVVGLDMVLTYKKTYTLPRGAADSNRFPGMGNYMTYLNFKDAIENNFEIVDCLQTDCGGYKNRLFDTRTMYKLEAS